MSSSLLKLSELVDIKGGGTPSKGVQEYWNGGIPWASVKDFKSTVLNTTVDSITQLGIDNSATNLIPKGSIVVPTRMAVGKVAMLGVDMAINQDLKALIIKDENKLDKRFLLRFLESQSNHILKHAKGATVKGITLDVLRELEIPLPYPDDPEKSLKEQKRIAAILDKADGIRRKRQQAIQLADDFLRSVFLDMFGDPVTNPKGWEVKTIEELVVNEKGAIKRGPFGGALKKEIFVDSGYLVYEQYHALNNDFSFARYFIDEETFDSLSGFEVKPGDLIISCSGVNLGRLACIPKGAAKGIINQALLKITLNESVMSNAMFMSIFRHPNFKNEFFGNTRGSGVPNFPPMSTFREFKFICPPVSVQRKYFEKIEKCELLKERFLASTENSDNAFNSLSQKSFKGEL